MSNTRWTEEQMREFVKLTQKSVDLEAKRKAEWNGNKKMTNQEKFNQLIQASNAVIAVEKSLRDIKADPSAPFDIFASEEVLDLLKNDLEEIMAGAPDTMIDYCKENKLLPVIN